MKSAKIKMSDDTNDANVSEATQLIVISPIKSDKMNIRTQ